MSWFKKEEKLSAADLAFQIAQYIAEKDQYRSGFLETSEYAKDFLRHIKKLLNDQPPVAPALRDPGSGTQEKFVFNVPKSKGKTGKPIFEITDPIFEKPQHNPSGANRAGECYVCDGKQAQEKWTYGDEDVSNIMNGFQKMNESFNNLDNMPEQLKQMQDQIDQLKNTLDNLLKNKS